MTFHVSKSKRPTVAPAGRSAQQSIPQEGGIPYIIALLQHHVNPS